MPNFDNVKKIPVRLDRIALEKWFSHISSNRQHRGSRTIDAFTDKDTALAVCKLFGANADVELEKPTVFGMRYCLLVLTFCNVAVLADPWFDTYSSERRAKGWPPIVALIDMADVTIEGETVIVNTPERSALLLIHT